MSTLVIVCTCEEDGLSGEETADGDRSGLCRGCHKAFEINDAIARGDMSVLDAQMAASAPLPKAAPAPTPATRRHLSLVPEDAALLAQMTEPDLTDPKHAADLALLYAAADEGGEFDHCGVPEGEPDSAPEHDEPRDPDMDEDIEEDGLDWEHWDDEDDDFLEDFDTPEDIVDDPDEPAEVP